MSSAKLLLEIVKDLRSLADNIAGIAEVAEPEEAQKVLKETKKVKKKSEPPKEEEAVTTPKVAPKEKAPSLEDVRALMVQKNREGHREAVKEILTKYGAQKLTALDPSHYKEVLKEVGEIK